MRKVFLSSVLFASLGLLLTGCLKDKGFDNQEYGINDPDTQPPGVGFPFGAKAKNDVGLNVSATTQVINDLVYVNLESGNAASSDINITLSVTSTDLVTAYNTANSTSILVLDPSRYNVATTMTIPAGQRNVQIPLNILNTVGLDANRTYAIGLTITGVNNNYTIAGNLKNLLIAFTIKNAYDGKYSMKGQFYHPSNDPAFSPHNFSVELHTSGPNSVRLYWPLVGDYNTPLTVNGGAACCLAAQELSFNINPATNAVTCVNTAVGATIVYDPILSYNGNNYNNRYDPVTKKIYAAFGYSLGAGNTVAFGASRAWIDTLTYTGPR